MDCGFPHKLVWSRMEKVLLEWRISRRLFQISSESGQSLAPMRFSILCLGFLGALFFFTLRLQASGFHNESIEVGGHTRTYRLFVPSDLPNPVPAIFVFHGTETPGHGIDSIIKITRFEEIGQIHHALIIFPEAYEGNWNDGRQNTRARSYREGIDDIAFVDAILAQTER